MSYKYICKCDKLYSNFIDWFADCKCNYCVCYYANEICYIRSRINNECSICYTFKYFDYSSTSYDKFLGNAFRNLKVLKNNIEYKSLEEAIDYLIKYSDNLIFD